MQRADSTYGCCFVHQRGRPHQPGDHRGIDDGQRDENVEDGGSEARHDRDREQDAGEGHQTVHRRMIKRIEARIIAGEQTEQEPISAPTASDAEADEERHAAAVDRSRAKMSRPRSSVPSQ